MKKSIILLLLLGLFTGPMISGTALGSNASSVRIAFQAEPSRLNPITYQDTETDFVMSQLCDPLLELDVDGYYTAEGAVIEDYAIQDEGRVYIFEIKEGLKFHNGEELTVEDVKFTYEAMMDKELASPHRDYYKDIVDLEIVDDNTLKVTLDNRNVTFLTTGRLRNHVLPEDYIEEVGWDGFEQNPIGSGPYQFVSHEPGQRIVLEKYDDYWHQESTIDRLEFLFYPEISSAIMALEAGEIDYIAELPAEEFFNLRQNQTRGLAFGSYNKFEDHRICFNKREDSIFSDPLLRRAVAYAINREELIQLTRGDMAVPAAGRIPDFHPATAPEAVAYEQDLDKARELLAEAGYPDGFATRIFAPSGYRERVLEVQQIQQQLSRVGIEVEVVTLEWGTYLDVTAGGEAPMFRERWSAASPSPFSFVENWHSESGWNAIFGTYHNDTVDILIDRIKKTVDQESRWGLYRRVQELVMEDVACYPLYWPTVGEAYNDQLEISEELWNVFRRPIYHINEWSFK
ncbi:MAG: ABC transporter substrate-binding protein [Bacillota bacterium]